MLPWKYAEEKGRPQAPLGVSAECIRRDPGRSLVIADYPRHDVAGIPHLQGISGVLRKNRDEHFGGPSAPAGRAWNYFHSARPFRRPKADLLAHRERNRSSAGPHGNGPVGCRSRTYRQSGACPSNAKRQGASYIHSAATLGRKENPFNCKVNSSRNLREAIHAYFSVRMAASFLTLLWACECGVLRFCKYFLDTLWADN